MKPPIRFVSLLLLALAGAFLFASAQRPAQAANPPAGTVDPTGPGVAWDGTAVGGASGGESTCVEGINCDTYTLSVSGAPADWTGKVVDVRISWLIPANDFDLYVHKGSNAGPIVADSGSGAPDTDEEATFDPSVEGTGTYTVHVVYFSVAGEQYHGTARAQNKPTARTASYLDGGITFTPNVTTKAPVASRDGEPSSRTDTAGNYYVAGIRGVPAGVDLWYDDLNSDPYVRNWVYRGQPDSFTGDEQTSVGGDGGGDVDLAVSRPNPVTGATTSPPTLAFSSLVLANISVGKSTNKGVSFTLNPLGNCPGGGACVDDRQWQEFYGQNTVFLLYRTIAPAVTQIQRSTDGGLTYGAAQTAGAIGQVGYIDVHQPTGTVYVSGSSGNVCHSTTALLDGTPSGYQCIQAATGSVANIFFVVKVADDGTPNGTVYVAYSDGHDIFLSDSVDRGVHWSQPVKVNHGAETATSLMPWLETGPTPGSVGVVWYGTSSTSNVDGADWQVFYAQSYDANSANPTFRQVTSSDHLIHGSNISTGGTLGTANRNLLDYFQVSYDPSGAAVIAYTDDHNDYDGHTYVTHQIGGPGLNASKGPVPTPGPPPPAQTGPSPSAASVGGEAGSQVTDFRHDVADGLLVVTPTDDPLDVLSVKYSCEGTGPSTQLVTSMKVSGSLAGLAPGLNWRESFAANAPNSTLSPTGDYSFGLSDRGDQFYLRASTDPTQSQFAFGTAVRNSDGSITYTRRGAATGSFDTATNTITMKVLLSSLNPFVTHGSALAPGSILAGLRGQSFTSQVNGKRDISRGGTQYTIGCAPVADLSVTKTDSPDPVHIGQNLTYTVNVTNNGPEAATGVTATDQLPKNAGYGSTSTTQGTCSLKPEKATVTCSLGTIASGGTVTITINVKPTRKGQITNTVSVSSASPPDPNTANNSATATTTVQP